MEIYSVKKTFADIGEIEYKICSSRDELEKASKLVYEEYLKRGYILSKYYKSGLRITLHNSLPGTTTFAALKGKEVIGAVTLIPDSPLGLPLDQEYKEDVDKLRHAKRRICEVGQLAIKSNLFGRGLFSMFNFKKLDFVFTLFKLVFQYALFCGKFDDLCVVVDPKVMLFKFLPFNVMGKVKYYGFDRVAIRRKPAVVKRLNLKNIEKYAKKRVGLHRIFLGKKMPVELFKNKLDLKPSDLRYFFVKKSDIFKKAGKRQLEYIKSCRGLTRAEFEKVLKSK